MLTDWVVCQLTPRPAEVVTKDGVRDEACTSPEKQTKPKSLPHTTNSGSTSQSTPLVSPPNKGLPNALDAILLLNICGHDCARECSSDMAASLAEQSLWDTIGATPQHFRRIPAGPRLPNNRLSSTTNQESIPDALRTITPPKCISVYRPRQLWPDGTLQIIWQQKERNAFGLKGVDKYEAHIELTLDDLDTIEIASDIASKYSGGMVEVHPDETTLQKIGSISCYLIRSSALRHQEVFEEKRDVPASLRALFEQSPLEILKSWRRREITRDANSDMPPNDFDDSVDEIYLRHHWHPRTPVRSYVWIENMEVDPRYRGVGLGLCMIEDACKRIADGFSWVLATLPSTSKQEDHLPSSLNEDETQSSLQIYFGLMGFAPLVHDDWDFMARWNASPLNPKLEEVLSSVPFTIQQSQDQGFQL